jgi:hypothetical protein
MAASAAAVSASGAASFAVAPKVSVSPTTGPRGTSVTVRGKGYQPGEQVKVDYKTGRHHPNPTMILICATTAADDGKFSCAGNIPTTDAGAVGAHLIRAAGQTSGIVAQTTFTLT